MPPAFQQWLQTSVWDALKRDLEGDTLGGAGGARRALVARLCLALATAALLTDKGLVPFLQSIHAVAESHPESPLAVTVRRPRAGSALELVSRPAPRP